MKDVLIITRTPEANQKVNEMLTNVGIEAGFSSACIAVCVPYSGNKCGVTSNSTRGGGGRTLVSLLKGGCFNSYHHSQLTPEIIATFPGVKQLPPVGHFIFGGVEYVVDGDEKRNPAKGDIYLLGDMAIEAGYETKSYASDSLVNWILRPLISEELQSAIDITVQTKANAGVANRLHMEALAHVVKLNGKTSQEPS